MECRSYVRPGTFVCKERACLQFDGDETGLAFLQHMEKTPLARQEDLRKPFLRRIHQSRLWEQSEGQASPMVTGTSMRHQYNGSLVQPSVFYAFVQPAH